MRKLYIGGIVALCAIAVGILYVKTAVLPQTVQPRTTTEQASQTPVVHLHNGDTFTLTAAPITKQFGSMTWNMLAYNGTIPGPTLRVHQGDTITIHFKNNTDLKTLLHSHGIRMENAFDGNQLVQKEMEPGESFNYTLTFPDAGVYWYHPHVRDDLEQPLGLYANIIVDPKDPQEWNTVQSEDVLALGDILVKNGTPAPYDRAVVTHAMMGRFGNTMVVNGKPQEELHMHAGEIKRIFITNVTAARVLDVHIANLKMKLVASDAGRFERETMIDHVVLGPSERAIVEVYASKPGTYAITHQTPETQYAIGTITVDAAQGSDQHDAFESLRSNATDAAIFSKVRALISTAPDRSVRMFMTMHGMGGMMRSNSSSENDDNTGMMRGMMGRGGMMGDGQPIEWEDSMPGMNAMSTDKMVTWVLEDEATKKQNMDIDWTFTKDSLVKIRLFNDPDGMHAMQHTFHTHGNRFIVLSTDGVPNDNMAWKDTVLVPSGSTIDIVLDASNPGKWMAHCHTLEHLHSGMMLPYTVTR